MAEKLGQLMKFDADKKQEKSPEKSKQQESETNPEHINLKVTYSQNDSVLQFKIKRHTALKKLKSAFCTRMSLDPGSVRFMFDGQPVNDDATPERMEMEEDDMIEVFQQQTGGAV